MNKQEDVIERFLRYVKIDTQSVEGAAEFPSSAKQRNLAEILVKELKEMGVAQADLDGEFCYVYALIPDNRKEEEQKSDPLKTLGFIAHMDTSPEVSGANVNPQIVKDYDGGDIVLGTDPQTKTEVVLSPEDFPELKNYKGKDLITTDGSTLLGADDKAGVAEIMTLAAYLCEHPEVKHGPIAIAFTPDEEVGSGVDHFDVKRFGADYAYTVDGGKLGEIEYENFNAASAVITIKGRSVHPGDAKDKMKNASGMALELENALPQEQKPEHTEKYEGFYHLIHIQGSVEKARMEYIIRDHDRDKFEEKKQHLLEICEQLNQKYGNDSFSVEIKDQYYNMREKIEPHMFLIDQVKECMQEMGITPLVQPIRGGTDGARLSFMGIPCPNLCTGGHNYHGRYEYCCIQSMEQIAELLVRISTIPIR